MTRPTPRTSTPAPGTRRAALDTPSRRMRRTLRKHGVLLAGGAAVVAIAGGALTVTQPALGEALGVPSASATPGLSGTDLDRAQAAATIATARSVVQDANASTDTARLEQHIASLADYGSLSGAALTERIAATVDTAQDVAQASADRDHRDAVERAAAAERASDRAAAAAAAAERAAAERAAAEAQARANTPAGAKTVAASMAASRFGWGADQFQCLDSLWTKESGWDYQAVNPNGGATGIPQALPGSKMATVAADWQTNATTQITWGLQYIDASYGTPCSAWSHSQAVNWY
ncbi:phospholipase [Curtobacterium sp. MCSS17_015]|uniref:aggregation-promoting factor C-terminal-like domain-containing protein n=1 Tax=Curtobacterium sp. MCSS17_015 TaxID=2175666 RepID=UPI0011B7215F|nr:phospholipase [Curtobacterium sp. MCSS17_015]WIB25595.1 phospholipase [Curtobacterium sp. MCSS17_015]